jgi:general secretion pathway protein A
MRRTLAAAPTPARRPRPPVPSSFGTPPERSVETKRSAVQGGGGADAAVAPAGGDGAYLAHWGLAEPPFLLAPDLRFAYERADHREGLARLLFGLTQVGGLVMITGAIGCGKTMLARTLAGTLDADGHRLVGVANPPRGAAGLLRALLAAAGEESRARSAADLAVRLRERIGGGPGRGPRTVLAVDEAQRLDARALDELRLLTNPEDAGAGGGALVVLLGQPELGARVARLPQVAQRVVVRYHLGPMSPAEVAAYVAHRTRVAGAPRPVFSERAALAVHAETGGVPRLVNLLCANALFVGYARGETQVGEDLVRDLAEDRRADERAWEETSSAA